MPVDAGILYKTVTICLAFILTFTSMGVQSEQQEEGLVVQTVETFGFSTNEGELSFFKQEAMNPRHVTGEPGFRLAAKSLLVETDWSNLSTSEDNWFTETSTRGYPEAVMVGLEHREGYQFSVRPTSQQVRFKSEDPTCQTGTPSGASYLEQRPNVNEDRHDLFRIDLEGAHEWSGCGKDTHLVIEGNFLLRLWEWDARIESGGQSTILHSGQRNPSSVPSEIMDLSEHAGQATERFIHVYGGTLEIPRLTGSYRAFAKDTAMTGANGMRLTGFTGPVMGHQLDDQDVHVGGDDLVLELGAADPWGPIPGALRGTMTQLAVDGQPLVSMSLAGPNNGLLPPGLWNALVPIAVVAAAILVATSAVWYTNPNIRNKVLDPIVRRRDVLFNEAMIEASERNADFPRRARRWAKLALRLRPNHPEALAVLGAVYFNMARYQKALALYKKAIINTTEHRPDDVDEEAIGMWAISCVRCLAGMRLSCNSMEERQQYTETILWYVRLAASTDQEAVVLLLSDTIISDLWDPIQRTVELTRYGIHP